MQLATNKLFWISMLGMTAIILTCGCDVEFSAEANNEPAANSRETIISGTLFGSQVEFTGAKFDGELALFEGQGWGFNQSLLIFLFLDDQEVPAGQTLQVTANDNRFGKPHVHCRFNGDDGELDTKVAMNDYQMKIEFGEINNGKLPGKFEFTIPGTPTQLRGHFLATLE